MSKFTIHSIDTAPSLSKSLLESAKRSLGFIPNLIAVMAESPATLESYQTLTQLFDNTSFTHTERQLILLSISRYRHCCYCLAAHSSLAKVLKVSNEIIDAVYYNQTLSDKKLEALRTFTRSVLKANGWVDQKSLTAFYQAGYNQQQMLEVILGVSFKTLSNFINQINDTPIDREFLSGLPENKITSCCNESA